MPQSCLRAANRETVPQAAAAPDGVPGRREKVRQPEAPFLRLSHIHRRAAVRGIRVQLFQLGQDVLHAFPDGGNNLDSGPELGRNHQGVRRAGVQLHQLVHDLVGGLHRHAGVKNFILAAIDEHQPHPALHGG